VGQGPGIGDIVDGRDLDARGFVRRAQEKPADPAETVYRDFYTS